MKPILTVVSFLTLAVATPDPVVTPRAELKARQGDPAVLGYVAAANGQFSDLRSCDFPAALSTSGNLAQCCASGVACTFWQSCNGGTLFASKTSLRCDQGLCNTAIIIPTVGASNGQDFLGCWATSFGDQPFTIVKDIGSAKPLAAPSSGAARSSASNVGGASSAVNSMGSSPDPTLSSPRASQSTSAAVAGTLKPLTGALGLVAAIFGML